MNKTTMTTISLNNSGGYDWVSDDQKEALAVLGWDVESSPYQITRLLKEDAALAEFTEVTGYTGGERGCDCCGMPFHWYEEDATPEEIAEHPITAMGLEARAVESLRREIVWREMRGEDASRLKAAMAYGLGTQEPVEAPEPTLDPQAVSWLALIGETP